MQGTIEHLIREVLPRDLTKHQLRFPNRRAKHDELAAGLRVTGPAARKEAQARAGLAVITEEDPEELNEESMLTGVQDDGLFCINHTTFREVQGKGVTIVNHRSMFISKEKTFAKRNNDVRSRELLKRTWRCLEGDAMIRLCVGPSDILNRLIYPEFLKLERHQIHIPPTPRINITGYYSRAIIQAPEQVGGVPCKHERKREEEMEGTKGRPKVVLSVVNDFKSLIGGVSSCVCLENVA